MAREGKGRKEERPWLLANQVEGCCGDLYLPPKQLYIKGNKHLSCLSSRPLFYAGLLPQHPPPLLLIQAKDAEDRQLVCREREWAASCPTWRGGLLIPECTLPHPVSGLGFLSPTLQRKLRCPR